MELNGVVFFLPAAALTDLGGFWWYFGQNKAKVGVFTRSLKMGSLCGKLDGDLVGLSAFCRVPFLYQFCERTPVACLIHARLGYGLHTVYGGCILPP
jgi:hypothetical protein